MRLHPITIMVGVKDQPSAVNPGGHAQEISTEAWHLTLEDNLIAKDYILSLNSSVVGHLDH